MTVGDPFAPVRPGQVYSPSARSINGALAAGQNFSRHKFDEVSEKANRGENGPQIYNSTVGAFDAFNVFGFSTPVLSPAVTPYEASERPTFVAAYPVNGLPFGITRRPLAPSGIVPIVTHGPAVVKILVSDAAHNYADVSTGVTGYLVSSASVGVPILWKDSGTGLKWAEVMLGTSRGSSYGDGALAPTNLLSSPVNTWVEIVRLEFESSGVFAVHADVNGRVAIATSHVGAHAYLLIALAYDSDADIREQSILAAATGAGGTTGDNQYWFASVRAYVEAEAGHHVMLYAQRSTDMAGATTWNAAELFGNSIGSIGLHRI